MSFKNKAFGSKSRDTKLWNDLDNAIDESLCGIALMNSELVVLKGCRAILRKDYDDMQGKVKIISGGGAGNEPSHSGFVGPGMLTAAVFGNINAAPSSESIFNVIKELGTDYTPGVLLVVQNFIGHRLNFTLAKTKAEKIGILVKILFVEDDTSVDENTRERRGLLGTLFVTKIAGAMAEEDKSIDEICKVCDGIVKDHGIISVGICTKISAPRADSGKPGEIEIGYGIHGEPGMFRTKFTTSHETVSMLLDYFLRKKYDACSEENFQPGHDIALLISNLGGSSQLETNIFVMEFVKQLIDLGFKVKRIYAGHLMTALSTSGFQISLMNLSTNEDFLRLLDAPTLAPAWPRNISAERDVSSIVKTGKHVEVEKDEEKELLEIPELGPILQERTAEVFLTILSFACDALIACANQINMLDADSGDGDCGTTLSRGAEAIKTAIKGKRVSSTRPFVALTQISRIIGRFMGGLQGGLYSLFFNAAAQVFANYSEEIDATLWLNALTAGNREISETTGTAQGDRTMLDPLLAAQQKFSELLHSNCHPIHAFGEAVSAAENRAIETAFMPALVGRPSMIKSKKFEHADAGAHAVGIWMRAAYEGIKLKFICQCEMTLQ